MRIDRAAWAAGLATLAAGLLAAAAVAAGGHAIANGHYTGRTAQRQATTLIVSASGRTITKLHTAVAYDGLCGSGGGGPAFQVNATNVPIRSSGSFSVTASASVPDAKPLRMIVTGSFVGRTVNGTVAELNGHCAAPKQTDNPYLTTFRATAP